MMRLAATLKIGSSSLASSLVQLNRQPNFGKIFLISHRVNIFSGCARPDAQGR